MIKSAFKLLCMKYGTERLLTILILSCRAIIEINKTCKMTNFKKNLIKKNTRTINIILRINNLNLTQTKKLYNV